MASIAAHINDSRVRLREITRCLDRMAELDGARNPKQMKLALRDLLCSAYALSHELRPLQVRIEAQLQKRDGKAAA